jgi:ketosteroid isomerase-like protein
MGVQVDRAGLVRQSFLNEDTARAIVEEAHRAWSHGDLEGVLSTYTEDIWFQRNSPDHQTAPFIVIGREGMRALLTPILDKAVAMAVVETFEFHSGIARSRVSYFMQDRKAGHTLTASYRQIVMFRGSQISRMEQFHDTARLNAFMALVSHPETRREPERS